MSGGTPVQRGILGDIVDWVGDQLSDLFDLLSNPGFWVGLLVTVVLFPVMGPGAIVVGGAAGGLVSGIHDNVKNGRPWYEPHTLIKHVAIGTFVGATFAFGGGFLVGLGLEGTALLGGTMVLSAGIGVGANVATGQRWDKGLLANLFLGWAFHKLAGPKGKGQGEQGEQGRGARGRTADQAGDEGLAGARDERATADPEPMPDTTVIGWRSKVQLLQSRIVALRLRFARSGSNDAVMEGRLAQLEFAVQAMENRLQGARSGKDLPGFGRELRDVEGDAYEVGRDLEELAPGAAPSAVQQQLADVLGMDGRTLAGFLSDPQCRQILDLIQGQRIIGDRLAGLRRFVEDYAGRGRDAGKLMELLETEWPSCATCSTSAPGRGGNRTGGASRASRTATPTRAGSTSTNVTSAEPRLAAPATCSPPGRRAPRCRPRRRRSSPAGSASRGPVRECRPSSNVSPSTASPITSGSRSMQPTAV